MKIRRVIAFVLALSLIMTDAPAYAGGVTDVTLSADGGVFDVYEDVSVNDISAGQSTLPVLEEENISIEIEPHTDVSAGDVTTTDEIFDGEYSFEEGYGAPVVPRLYSPGINSVQSLVPVVNETDYFLYYNQLDPIGKAVYDFLETNLDNFSNPQFTGSVDIKSLGDYLPEAVKGGFMEGYAAFDYDHPRVFWLNPNSFTYNSYKNSVTGYSTRLEVKKNSKYDSFFHEPYASDASLIDRDKALMEDYVSSIVSSLENESSLEAVVTSINDSLVLKNYYNRYVSRGYKSQALSTTWESLSALTDQQWMTSDSDYGDPGAPVCEGYSRAFKVIADRLGIPAILVTGNNHMWNYVYDETWGGWYGLDITWDDPVRGDEWTNRNTPDGQLHQYILKGGSSFDINHKPNGAFWKNGTPLLVPELNDESYHEVHGVEDAIYWIEAVDSRDEVLDGSDENLFATSNLNEAIDKAILLSDVNPEKTIIIQMNRNHTFTDLEFDRFESNSNIVLSLNGKNVLFDGYSELMVVDIPVIDNAGSLSMSTRGEVEFKQDIRLSEGSKIDILDGVTTFKYIDTDEIVNTANAPVLNVNSDANVWIKDLTSNIGDIILKRSDSRFSMFLKEKGGLRLYPVQAVVYAVNSETDTEVLLKKCVTVGEALDYINTLNNSGKSYIIGLFDDISLSGGLTAPTKTSRVTFRAMEDFETPGSEGVTLSLKGNFNSTVSTGLDKVSVAASNATASKSLILKDATLKTSGNASVGHLYLSSSIVDVAGNLTVTDLSSLTSDNVISYGENQSNVFKLTGVVDDMLPDGDSDDLWIPSGDTKYSFNETEGLFEESMTGEITLSEKAVTVSKKYLRVETAGVLEPDATGERYLSFVDKPVISGTGKATAYWFRVERPEIYGRTDNSFVGILNKRSTGLFYETNSVGIVTLNKDGHFAGYFASVQDALNEITMLSSAKSDYEIIIEEEVNDEGTMKATVSGRNVTFPKAGKCASITVKSGDSIKKRFFYKNEISINSGLIFENIILVPDSKIGNKLTLRNYDFELKSCELPAGTVIGTVSGTGKFSLKNSNVTVNKEFKAGTLSLDASSDLTTLSAASVNDIEAPRGTWHVAVKTGLSGNTPQASVKKDFLSSEGEGLTLIPVTDSVLSAGALIKAPALSTVLLDGEAEKKLVKTSNIEGGYLVKKSGNIVTMSAEPEVTVVNDLKMGTKTVTINDAVSEISNRAANKDYRIILGSDALGLTAVPAASAAGSLAFVGNGNKIRADKALSFGQNVIFEDVIFESPYALTFKDLSTVGTVTLKNKVSTKGKSQIVINGSLSTESPLLLGLFKDKDLSVYAPVGRTTDAVYSDVLVTASGNFEAGSLALMEGNLPEGATEFTPETFLTLAGNSSYMITKIGNVVRVLFKSGLEAVVVREDAIYNGNLEGHKEKIIGFYPGLNDAFADIDRLNNDGEFYSVVVLKNTEKSALVLPTHARKVVISGGNSIPQINLKGSLTVNTDVVFSNVLLGGTSQIAVSVNARSLELINRANTASGSSWGKISLSDGTEFVLTSGTLGGATTYNFRGNIDGAGAVFRTDAGLVNFYKNVSLKTVQNKAEFGNIYNNGTLKADKIIVENYACFNNMGVVSKCDIELGEAAFFKNYGTVDAGVLEYTGPNSKLITRGVTTLKGIKTDGQRGIIEYSDGTVININGDIVTENAGSVLCSMTGCADVLAMQVVAGTDGKLNFVDSNKLIGIKGLYNEDRVSFSINGRSSIDTGYLCVYQNGIYYTDVNNEVFPSLYVYDGGELSGRVKMSFADIQSVSTLINAIGEENEEYCLELPDENKSKIKGISIVDKCVLPGEGKCRELTVVHKGTGSNPVRVSAVSGGGNVVFKGVKLVSGGAMKHTGNVNLTEGANLELKKNSSLKDVYLEAGTYITALQGLSLNNMDGEEDEANPGYVNTKFKGSKYPGMTLLRVKGYWSENVKVRAYGFNATTIEGNTPSPIGAIVRNKDGYITDGVEELCETRIFDGDGRFLTYHRDLTSAMKYLETSGNKAVDYRVELRTDVVTGGTFEVRGSDGKLTGLTVPSTVKSLTLVSDNGEEVTIKGAAVNSKASLKLENVNIESTSAVTIPDISVSGDVRILTDRAVKLGNISGSGNLYIKATTTKAVRTKSSAQLTINGDISADTIVRIVPYEYANTKAAPVAVSNESVMSVLVNRGESPKSYKKLANIPKADITNLSVCRDDGTPIMIGTTEIDPFIISGGLYVSIDEPLVELEGRDAENNVVIKGEYLTLGHALTAINKVNGKKTKYTVTLNGDVGSTGAPMSVSLPEKTSELQINGNGHKLYFSNTVSLKTNTVLKDIEPVYMKKVKKTYTVSTGTVKTGSKTLTLEGVLGDSKNIKISGSGSGRLLVYPGAGRTLNAVEGITGIANMEIQDGKMSLSGDASITNLSLDNAELTARNVTVKTKLSLKDSKLSSGNDTVGTGKLSLKNVEIAGSGAMINGKQDKNGNSLISLSGTVTKAAGAPEELKLTVGLYYNNSMSNYAQWYLGMTLMTAPRADVNLISPRYTGAGIAGMGKISENCTLARKNKKLVITKQD